ncbi:MAG: amidohydrolase family protein, partial [Eudoraea sp.]|uniref:amidohydrolase family protein n=1 Tax=Eudoraea sp. TaxID=1979955 RepID=UPI003C77671B
HDAGITLVAGTDAMAGVILHRELENYVKAGISTADVLQMATLGAAEVSETSEKLGSIEEGKLADMILVNGNPLEDISDIRKVDLTIKNGNLYDPVELYKVVGVKPYK